MKKGTLIILAVVLGLAVLVGASGLYRVDEGEQALVLTFGEISSRRGPGLYWRVPGIQTVEKASITHIYSNEFGFRTTESRQSAASSYSEIDDEAIMLTGDSNIVRVEAIYQWVIRDVQSFLYVIDDPEKTMNLAFETVVRRNIQNKNLDDALLNKRDIEREVLPEFQRMLDAYGLGVTVREVRIQNITVPVEVQAAYEDVNNAMNEKTRNLDEAERYKNEVLPAARANAYRRIQEAEAYKATTIAQAEGDVALFNEVLRQYNAAKDITRQRLLIETMESILSRASIKYIIDGGETDVLPVLTLNPEEGGAPVLPAAGSTMGGGQ